MPATKSRCLTPPQAPHDRQRAPHSPFRFADGPLPHTHPEGRFDPFAKPSRMAAICVPREKAALSSGCKSHPANAPAGSNRSSHGGDEMAEAFGVAGHV